MIRKTQKLNEFMTKKMLALMILSNCPTWDYGALVMAQWLKQVILNH